MSADPEATAEERLREHEQRRQRGTADDGDGPPPDLLEAWRQLHQGGRAGLSATGDAITAFRQLVVADVALARSAAGRAAVFIALAVVFGGSAWLMLMASLIVFLSRTIGIAWWISLFGTALASLLVAAVAAWAAARYFDHTRLRATRRQLARLGLGDRAPRTPPPGSPLSARDTASAQQRADAPPAHDGRPPGSMA